MTIGILLILAVWAGRTLMMGDEPISAAIKAANLQDMPTALRGTAFTLRAVTLDNTWRAAKSSAVDTVVGLGASILEERIVTLRQQALEDGTQPMPETVKDQLVGYFPKAVLERVRYKIGWSDRRLLHSNLFRLVNARAIALIDVIVFRDTFVAADPAIWAHELAHVQQYERWGVSEFARHYLREPGQVEWHAWEIAARYTMWALQEGRLHEPLRPPPHL